MVLVYTLPRIIPPVREPQPEEKVQKKTPPPTSKTAKQITLVTSQETTDKLLAPDGSVRSDIEIITELLALYRRALHGNPTGENEEITAALTGRNIKGIAMLPSKHRAISPQGELIDRWHTPYFFHAISGKHMEIRSAGPDRKFYTDDDILSNP